MITSSKAVRSIKDHMTQYRDFLEERMDSDFGLLDKLRANGTIGWREMDDVKSQGSSCRRNAQLLDYILTKDQCDGLITVLRDADQMHIVNYLTANGEYSVDFGEEWPLTEKEIAILDTNHESLVDLLELTDLLGLLYSANVINRRQKDSISSKPTQYEKNDALLDILRRRSLRHYRQTMICLRQSQQRHIAKILECGGAVVRVHAHLDGENVTETENEISTAIANMIMNDRSTEDADRILELVTLKVIGAKTGQSVVLYIYCKTIEELQQLHESLTSGRLKDSVETWFSRLLSRSQKIALASLTTPTEEFENMRTYFKEGEISRRVLKSKHSSDTESTEQLQTEQRMASTTETDDQPSKTTLNELPLELLDVVLEKSFLHWTLNPSFHQRDEDVIKALASVDFCWFQRLIRPRFKKRIWRRLKGNMSIRYVRAIYDFPASRPDEVSLRKGDVARVLKDLDQNWVRGVVRRAEGVFPVTFVEPLGLPEVQEGERVFAGIEDFKGGEDGDLCFGRGDVLVGTTAIDENWWEGFSTSTHTRGIFPLTHVEELDPGSPHGHGTQGQRPVEQATEVLAEAKVIKGLQAQLEDELDLVEGEKVQILKFLDDGFCLGQCCGKVGQFPLSFVKVIGESSGHSSGPSNAVTHQQISNTEESGHQSTSTQNNGYLKGKKSHSRKGSYTQANTRSHDAFVLPYAQTRHPFAAVNENELSFSANEIVTLISHIDDDWAEGEINGRRGIFPTSYVNIIVDCQPVDEANRGHNGSAVIASPETYGRVLYDFTAENSEELNLQEGDTVTILQQLDADWYLAQHDDSRIGRCPVSYVEVFGCEPLHGVTTPSAEVTNALQSVTTNFTPHDVSTTGVKPKPTVKPKPILKTSSMSSSHGGLPVKSNDRQHSTSTNPVSFNIGGKPVDGCRPNSPIAKRRPFQLVNTRMSLDEVVQRQFQQVKCHTPGLQSENSGSEMAVQDRPPMSSVRPRSVSVLGNETAVHDERGSSANVESRTAPAFPRMSTESPIPMARTSRPDSLNVPAKQPRPLAARGAVKKKPTPPPRPFGSKPSPSKPKLVPKRSAPPCPVIDRSGRSHSHNDLMIFSPDQGTSDVLQTSLSTPTMEKPQPIPAVRSSPSVLPTTSASELERQMEKRQRIIAELIQTESDYVNSLVLCLKTFSSMAKACPPTLDLDILFGNADEVVELSQRLLAVLEQNVETKPSETQCVGKCFIELKDQFQRVYAPYCRNHDSVIALLEKYESNPEVSEFIRSALDQMRQHSQIFDLNSILIKPVQRILKYPLLLSELDRSTEDSHVDKRHLGTAISTMTHIAAYINEYKRRKDLVFKYKLETDTKFSDKISRLTMHSTMKKLSRISRKMVGIQTVDEKFNHEEQRFKALDCAIRNLTRDISQYIEQCEDALECKVLLAVNISEIFDKETPELAIEKLCEVHQQISSALFLDFKAEVESDILPPLNSLLLMYQGPNKVIRKRYDKLLDFDSASARLRSVGDSDQVKAMDEELSVARKNYEALNAQLLDDLPKLYNLSMDILISCLTRFIQSQQRFLKKALDKLHDLLRLPLLLGTGSNSNIVEAFNIAHAIAVEKMSDLSFIPKTFNPQADQVRRMKEQRRSTIGNCDQLIDVETRVSQGEGQRSHLRQTYPAGRLFWVSQDFVGSQTMDLNLSAGSLVGVMKEVDPMGNRDRWFVDNGVEKGFVLKQFLSGQQPGTNVSGSVSQKALDLLDWLDPVESKGNGNVINPQGGASFSEKPPLANMTQWVRCEDDFPPTSPLRQNSSASVADHSPQPSEDVFYQAVYEFRARNANELSMNDGQLVRVIAKEDLDGNSEWWQVEREDGQRGYVPSSYLYAVH